jgi:hypothetical protein
LVILGRLASMHKHGHGARAFDLNLDWTLLKLRK